MTIELRHVLDILSHEETDLFDFDYPICDINWKKQLEELIKEYFYFHEIGLETIDLFIHRFRVRLKTIMSYYNELFKTTLMDIDPFINYYMKEEIKESTDTKGKTNSKAQGSNLDENTLVEYPQHSNISKDIPKEMTQSKGSANNTTEGTSEGQLIKDYKKIIEGSTGNKAELLKAYRETIININKMIIEDLKTLFILVY